VAVLTIMNFALSQKNGDRTLELMSMSLIKWRGDTVGVEEMGKDTVVESTTTGSTSEITFKSESFSICVRSSSSSYPQKSPYRIEQNRTEHNI